MIYELHIFKLIISLEVKKNTAKKIKNTIRGIGIITLFLTAGAMNLTTAITLISISCICLWATGSFKNE